jgi:mannose-6-phosphate isomerase-like protein (cupin superfamily)
MIKDIYYKDTLVGQFYDLNHASGIQFPTSAVCEFQFGFGTVEQDKNLVPHIHKRVERVINTTSEFLYVVDGEMTIEVYSEDEAYVETVVLNSNQALLQHIGGHKISLKKGTKYFEIKQGPYFGRYFDKYDIECTNES